LGTRVAGGAGAALCVVGALLVAVPVTAIAGSRRVIAAQPV
jgi:hypothetical protein